MIGRYTAERQSPGPPAPRGAASDGFAAVDALVALTILSTAIALSIGAVGLAQRSAATALEGRRAAGLLVYLLDGLTGTASGRTAGFDWRVEGRPGTDPHQAASQACERSARLRSVSNGRAYTLSTAVLCPVPRP